MICDRKNLFKNISLKEAVEIVSRKVFDENKMEFFVYILPNKIDLNIDPTIEI